MNIWELALTMIASHVIPMKNLNRPPRKFMVQAARLHAKKQASRLHHEPFPRFQSQRSM